MRNAPHTDLAVQGQEIWIDLDAPRTRFGLLAVLMVVPLAIIGLRLLQVQVWLSSQYVDAWDRRESVEEIIPALDGRILSSDGVVLADNRPRYDLEVEYRWLENPPDPDWLKREANGLLSKSDRRQPAAVERARQRVLASRDQLWMELADLLGIPQEELDSRRARIQQRVERMVAAVERKRVQELEAQEVQPLRLSDGLQGIWQRLVSELTTEPRRTDAPVTLREEVGSHVIFQDLPAAHAAMIQSLPHRFRGALVQIAETRTYPQGELAGHVLGQRRLDVETHSMSGQNGLEKAYDRVLSGHVGRKEIVRDRQGTLLSDQITAEPRDGHDLILTIDSRLQRAAEQLIDRVLTGSVTSFGPGVDDGDMVNQPPVGGAIIVMDVRTGDVLAAASGPRVSQDVLLAPTPEQWDQIQSDPRRPLFNRVTQAAVSPGSVFKLLTSVALLENKTFQPDEPFVCQGYLSDPSRDRCYIYRRYGTGHGQVMLADALAQSCNVYFFEAARRMGPTPLVVWGKRFGFGAPTGIDLPGEASGHLPDPFHLQPGEQWQPGMTLQLAIGQGTLTVTPLQILELTAAIANNGSLVTPRLVREIQGQNSESDVWQSGKRPMGAVQSIAGLHPDTLAAIREGMELSVSHPQGTGRLAYEAELSCAGKTGTAETSGDKGDHAWFAGYAPVDQPRVAFVIFLENGGSGGQQAAPLARQLLIELAQCGYLPLN